MIIVNVKRVSITSAFKFYLLISFSLVNWISKHNLCAAASGPGLSVSVVGPGLWFLLGPNLQYLILTLDFFRDAWTVFLPRPLNSFFCYVDFPTI